MVHGLLTFVSLAVNIVGKQTEFESCAAFLGLDTFPAYVYQNRTQIHPISFSSDMFPYPPLIQTDLSAEFTISSQHLQIQFSKGNLFTFFFFCRPQRHVYKYRSEKNQSHCYDGYIQYFKVALKNKLKKYRESLPFTKFLQNISLLTSYVSGYTRLQSLQLLFS